MDRIPSVTKSRCGLSLLLFFIRWARQPARAFGGTLYAPYRVASTMRCRCFAVHNHGHLSTSHATLIPHCRQPTISSLPFLHPHFVTSFSYAWILLCRPPGLYTPLHCMIRRPPPSFPFPGHHPPPQPSPARKWRFDRCYHPQPRPPGGNTLVAAAISPASPSPRLTSAPPLPLPSSTAPCR